MVLTCFYPITILIIGVEQMSHNKRTENSSIIQYSMKLNFAAMKEP